MLERFRDHLINFITSRLVVLTLVFLCLGGVLIHRIFELQIVNGEQYLNEFSLKIRKERSIQSSRGKIYDRNGKLLAYNDLAYSVTIEDVYEAKNKNANLNATLLSTLHILKANGDDVVSDFGVYLDKNGNYEFSSTGTRQLRFLADVYGHAALEDLKESEKNATAQDVVEDLCTTYSIGERTDSQDAKSFVPGKGYTKEEALQLVTIRYAMKANSFQKYIPTTIATDVSEQTVAAIKENNEALLGIDIAEDPIRRYVDGTYFSHIIGYTGRISSEELQSLNDSWTEATGEEGPYERNDTVGKSGIEREMEIYLQGKKGSETIYVDNLGKEIESENYVEPVAGGDVYLSLDADLQEAVYNILEQSIAGILLEKIKPVKESNVYAGIKSNNIIIPIDDVYNALFNNNVIDMEHLAAMGAGENEKAVYQAFLVKKEKVWDWLREELYTGRTPYKELSEEHQAYESYIVNELLIDGTGILTADSQDSVYLAWSKEESLSLSELLEHAISRNWLDVTELEMDGRYADSSQVFDRLVDYILLNLDETPFHKKLYQYMIHDNSISGSQVCMVLVEQGLVSVSGERLDALNTGAVSAYSFMLSLIEELQITPAQLALDPFSGSCVVVDPGTGEVLALVSYPSYDNNRLANGIDADYYASLQNDLSKPLWDYATQMKTAPGSTYKPVSAATALMNGVVTLEEDVDCEGYFTRYADRALRCWIAPGAHGNLDVTGAISNSCNYFFYEMGYRLGLSELDGTTFSNETSNEKMKEYADLFGLTEKTGIEIEETTPEFSDQTASLSAIGQGNHNYTTVGLARYAATIANRGSCYNLSLLDKVTDHNGNLLEDFSPKLRNTVELPTAFWEAIHSGMKGVVEKKDYFQKLELETAGKTGTAEENKLRPAHALFIGFAPYEDPQIALAARIANGYSSDYAAQISCKVIEYIFGLEDEDVLLSGKAVRPDAVTSSGD